LESRSAPLHAARPDNFLLVGAGPADDVARLSMPLPTVPSSLVAATPCGPRSGAQLLGSSVLPSDPAVPLSSAGAPLDSSVSSSSFRAPSPHAHTCLQNAIINLKKLFPGMIRYANFCASGEPESVKEALTDRRWKQAMDVEYSTLLQNQTWHLVPATQASNIIDYRWVFKVKRRADGSIERYKACLVAKGVQAVLGN
jgi:hypothetical protein